MPTRRQFIGAAAGATAVAGVGGFARAQTPSTVQGTVDGWPARSVRVISPTGTGGPGQNFRLYADQLKDDVRAELRAREHAGRLRRARQHGGGARGARRTHAAARLQQPHRAGAAGAGEFAGQRQTRFRADRADVHLPVPAAGQRGAAGAQPQGARRLRQGAARPAQLLRLALSAPADIW